ncbi:expressed protein [Echinococcus multilocularis]|uniref:Expressed protein n=1 Tax=Echinococcus multilocularis TaxID=6211 RepID=A0A068YJY2_ECHMU|nr:expressed protein [Echinococcus multilocularis]
MEGTNFPPPQSQVPVPAPGPLGIILTECCTLRYPFPDGSSILMEPGMLDNPMFPHITDLFFQCPCRIVWYNNALIVDSLRASDVPLIVDRLQYSPFYLLDFVQYNMDSYMLNLPVQGEYDIF